MKQTIQQLLAGIVKTLFDDPSVLLGTDAEIDVTIPENTSNGDYTTNCAMILAGRLKAPPVKIGQKIVDAIKKYQNESGYEWLERVEIAPPGFVNLWLSKEYFGNQIKEVLEKKEQYGVKGNEVKSEKGEVKSDKKTIKKKRLDVEPKTKSPQSPLSPIFPQASGVTAGKEEKKGTLASFGNPQKIMVEFAHPNTHKAFHIGHLRNITTGESIVRLLESQGHEVVRANYQGDVGMHIAKCLYSLKDISKIRTQDLHTKIEWLGKAYAVGSKAFEASEDAKKAIGEINKQIYAKDPAIYPLYKETRQWSLEYFDSIYKRVGSHFDRLYFESETYETGKINVLEGLKKGIFEESQGAIIFPGEKYGLHNRVFVTSEGNATYEGKDMGLAPLQHKEYHPDLILHVLGPEQYSYTRVMFQALDVLFPNDAGKQFHLVYGWVKLKSGKMSSRSGVVVLGEWLLDEAKKSIYTILDHSSPQSPLSPQSREAIAEAAAVAAVKYAFLRVGTNQEIAFDLKESISFDGDSGPYLLYTYARCKSVLRKASDLSHLGNLGNLSLNPEERSLARRISQFPEVVADAATRFAPNALCTYLFHLAQEFNVFYAKHPILDKERITVSELRITQKTNTKILNTKYIDHNLVQTFRLALTAATAQVLKNGLYLLGISTVERM